MKINWFALNGIKPFDKPEEEKTTKIKVGWLNEAKDYYFSLDDMTEEPYRLTVTGFADCEVELYQLNSTQAHIGRGVTWGEIPQAPEASFYDCLQPFVIQEEVPISSYQLFCLRLTGTAPGKWQGEIRATQGKISVSKTLTFEVLPLLLPTQTAPTLELWQYPFAVARYYQIEPKDYFNKAHCERIAESLAYYAEAGGDTIVTTIVHDPWNHQTYDAYPSLVTWQQSGEKMTFDFTWFDQYVALCLALGINQKIKCFSMLPWEDKIYYFDEAGVLQERIYPVDSPQWQKIWRDFLTAFVQHLEEKGWFDITYIAIDERPAETLTNVLQLIKEHPNQEGKMLKVSCALNYQSFDHTLLEQIADLAIGQPHLGDQTVFRQWCEQRRTKGLTTSIYNCVGDYPAMFLYSHPFESQWVIWNTVAYGADGFLRWALDAWVKDPLVNGSHWYWESGDPFLLYPGEKGAMMSLRFQQMQQALNDSRKYLFLQKKQPALVSEVTQLLDGWPQLSGKTNDYGAQVPFSENETLQLIQTIQQMHDLLEKGARAYLKESNK